MKPGYALKPAVREQLGIFVQELSTAALFQHLEIVNTTFAISCAEDALAGTVYEELAFVRMPLFLTRVVAPLFFWDAQRVTQRYQPRRPLGCTHRARLYVLAVRTRLSL